MTAAIADLAAARDDNDRQLLDAQEQHIATALAAFLVVGRALGLIRDRALYRFGYATFELYCAARWQLSRPRAYELIAAATLCDSLSAMADTPPLPTNERQCRVLAGLDLDDAAAVLRAAGEPLTAKKISEARAALTAVEAEEPVEQPEVEDPEPLTDEDDTVVDAPPQSDPFSPLTATAVFLARSGNDLAAAWDAADGLTRSQWAGIVRSLGDLVAELQQHIDCAPTLRRVT